MGSLWCDMTSVVSQNLIQLSCERSPSEARAAECNGHDYSNTTVKILNTNCSLIKFCVFDSVSKRWVKISSYFYIN